MTRNRQTHTPDNPLAEMIRLMSGTMLPPSTAAQHSGGPRIRTFTFGNGAVVGGTISIGGGQVLGTDEDGFIRDPWSGGRTAGQGARETFPSAAREGNPLAGEGNPGAGYVTIEDLLSHFLGEMTGLGAGAGGGGPMGDYVLSDGESPTFCRYVR